MKLNTETCIECGSSAIKVNYDYEKAMFVLDERDAIKSVECVDCEKKVMNNTL